MNRIMLCFLVFLSCHFCSRAQLYFGANSITTMYSTEDKDVLSTGILLEYRFQKKDDNQIGSKYFISTEIRNTGYIDGYRLNISSGVQTPMANRNSFFHVSYGGFKNWDPHFSGFGMLGELGVGFETYKNWGKVLIINRRTIAPLGNGDWLQQSFFIVGLEARISAFSEMWKDRAKRK